MRRKRREGTIEVVCGPMFAGKSSELLRQVERALLANYSVQVFKSALDDRYAGVTKISSHSGRTCDAIPVKTSKEIIEQLAEGVQFVAVDEVQFFDAGIVPVVVELARRGINVLCVGIDMDFRGEVFGPMGELLGRADIVEKLTAICRKCGEEARFSQRLIAGRAARYDEPVVVVGAEEGYEARCRHCHEVPGRPKLG